MARRARKIDNLKTTSTSHTTNKGSKTELAQQAYNKAIDMCKMGYTDKAKPIFESLLTSAPEFTPSYIKLAELEFNNKNYLKAFAILCYAYNYSYADEVTKPLAKVFYELRPHLYEGMNTIIKKTIKNISQFRHHLSSDLFECSCLEESLEQIEILEESGDTSILTIAGKAICLQKMGHPEEAINLYKKILKKEPMLTDIKWNIALCEIQIMGKVTKENLGYYREALKIGKRPPLRKFTIPLWNGEDIMCKRLLIYPEQGIGDEIRFVAHLNNISPLAKSCTLECAKKLEPLFKRSFPNVKVTGILSAEFMQEYDLKRTDADFCTPMGELRYHDFINQGVYKTPKKFLIADKDKIGSWKQKIEQLSPNNSNLKVAICWRSQNMNERRIKSYSTLKDWAELLKTEGVTFFNANYADGTVDELAAFEKEYGIHINNFPELNQKDDLDSTAAYLSNMDLVISVGTAVCELASGLGIKTWRIENFSPNKDCSLKKHGFDLASAMRFEKHYSQDWSELFLSVKRTLHNYINDN